MKPLLAIVVPVFNEEDGLPSAIIRLLELLKKMINQGAVHRDSFILFVDDGSTDASWTLLKNACFPDSMLRAIKLTRNYGHNIALLAGLTAVKDRCEVSISIDCDLQQDPEAMFAFLQKYKAGAEIVFGIRNDRNADSLYKKYTALSFYKISKLMGIKVHTNHADYRLLSSKVLRALSQYHEPNIFLRAVIFDMGFPNDFVYFDVIEREHGRSKYTVSKMLKLGIEGIVSFTAVPLRIISILGVIVFGLSLLMCMYVLTQAILIGGTVPGWASTLLPIYLLGGLQILCMGVIGEYLAQVYSSAKRRPRYIVEAELL